MFKNIKNIPENGQQVSKSVKTMEDAFIGIRQKNG